MYRSWLTLTVLLASVSGCGPSGGERTYPVSGRVTVASKLLTTGAVNFHPDASRGNTLSTIAVGTINEQGVYQLMTRSKSGAPAGWYKVTVNANVPSNPKDPYSPPRWLTDRSYTDPKTTPLSVEVKPDAATGAYDLALAR